MIKVRMITPEEQKTDLLPEHLLFREMLGHFHGDAMNSAITVNGTLLEEKDLDRSLAEFSRDAELTVVSIRNGESESREKPEDGARNGNAEVLKALIEARKALNEAMDTAVKVLGVTQPEELPF